MTYLIIHLIGSYLGFFRKNATDDGNSDKADVICALVFSWIWFIAGIIIYFQHKEEIFFTFKIRK
jgi:uncharacterized membrane protein (UPF0136 family)